MNENQMTLFENTTPAQAEAVALHYEIITAARAAADSLLNLGRKLKQMRDTGHYKDLGFDTFAAYTETAVGIRQRQAYNYISVVEKLPAQLIEENAAAGVTKLALLAKLGPADREEVAADGLANITVAELQKIIDERNNMAEQLAMFETSAPADTVEADAHEVDMEQLRAEIAEELEAKHAAELEAAKADAQRTAEKAAADKIAKAKADAKAKAERQIANARKEAADAAAAEQAEKDRAELAAAQQRATEATQRAAETAKQLKLQADDTGIKFGLLFQDMQDKAYSLADLAGKLAEAGRIAEADKYRQALHDALLLLAEEVLK